MFRIFLTNLGKYNEGELMGKWVDCPCDDWESELEYIGVSDEPDEYGRYYEEYFISDYESDCGVKISEYESLDDVNDLAERCENLSYEESEILGSLNDYLDFEESLEIIENGDYRVYWGCNDMESVAMEYVEDCGLLGNMDSELARYFDYEAFGRDMEMNGNFIEIYDGSMMEYWW